MTAVVAIDKLFDGTFEGIWISRKLNIWWGNCLNDPPLPSNLYKLRPDPNNQFQSKCYFGFSRIGTRPPAEDDLLLPIARKLWKGWMK